VQDIHRGGLIQHINEAFMNDCIVAGGGISGLFAAILAKEHCDNVTVIESEASCGGLLRSWQNDDGVVFDFGTHIPCETAYEPINNILFKGMYENPEQWTSMDITRVSNSFQGRRYDTAQFMPLNFLPEADYKSALVEILSAPGLAIGEAQNFEQYSLANYGLTITDKIFRPLMKKLQNAELAQLHPTVHTFFALTRFVPGDAQLCRELKKSALFDDKLAFASYEEGLSGSTKFYPKARGIELWVKQLIAQAKEKGVQFKTATRITGLQQADGKVTSVTLNGAETQACDHLIWTSPPIFAIKQLGIEYQGVSPAFCPMSLHHLVFDQPFLDRNYYSNINDWDYQGFRLTLYPNVTLDEPTGPYSCTVEVLCSDIKDNEALNDVLVKELKALAYVSQDANLLSYHIVDIPMGFPQLTSAFVAEKSRQVDLIHATIDNMTLIGKASKEQFFIYGILHETWVELGRLFEQGNH
jgi:protoporphyrinogen oxidase